MKRRGLIIGMCAGLLAACAAPSRPPATPAPTLANLPFATRVTPLAVTAAVTDLPLTDASATPLPPTSAAAPDPTASGTPPAASPSPNRPLYLPFVGQAQPTVEAPAQRPPTAVPPTETPVPWPPALDHLTASKLSVHTLNNSEPYVMPFVQHARPRLIKAVGDYGWLKAVKAASPDTVTLGRIVAQQDEWIQTVDPAVAGQAYVDLNAAEYQANPFVDYWEGWNEFVPITSERMKWFAQFEAARACAMQARGWRAAVGGFSTGVPEFALMADFLPALEAAQRCGGVFHLHEYTSPTFDCGVAVNQPGLIPGAPALSVPAGPLALRYRFWYELILKPHGLGTLPLYISELGIDGVQVKAACNDPGGTGWKGYGEWWVQRGLGPDAAGAYVNVLKWYDAQLRADPYVLGAVLFTTGAVDAGSGWQAFDLHDVLLPLANYLVSQP